MNFNERESIYKQLTNHNFKEKSIAYITGYKDATDYFLFITHHLIGPDPSSVDYMNLIKQKEWLEHQIYYREQEIIRLKKKMEEKNDTTFSS